MGNKKTIIQLVVIIGAFIAAGFVLYEGGLFGGGSPASAPGATPAALSGAPKDVLPYGDTLDFSKVIDPTRFQYDLVQYPKLDSQNDVGIPEAAIITPPSSSK